MVAEVLVELMAEIHLVVILVKMEEIMVVEVHLLIPQVVMVLLVLFASYGDQAENFLAHQQQT